MNDYINREWLLDVVENIIKWDTERDRNRIIHQVRELTPPADVRTVMHGRWKKTGRWGKVYRCDQCGNYLDFDGVNVGRGDANYCPNCGADMRGE